MRKGLDNLSLLDGLPEVASSDDESEKSGDEISYSDDETCYDSRESMSGSQYALSFYGTIQKMRRNGELDYMSTKRYKSIIESLRWSQTSSQISYKIPESTDYSFIARLVMNILLAYENDNDHDLLCYSNMANLVGHLYRVKIAYTDITAEVLADMYIDFLERRENLDVDSLTVEQRRELYNDRFMVWRIASHAPAVMFTRNMFDLWDKIDPEKDIDGIGNLVVWLPRERLEDIIELVTKDHR